MSKWVDAPAKEHKKADEAVARAAALAFSLPPGMTYGNLNELLSSELNEDFGGGGSYEMGGGRLWIRDFDDQYVVYEDRDGSLTRRAYTLAEGNDVRWGMPEEVAAQTAYLPIAGSESHAFAGKRHNKSDQQIIQTMHDHATSLGAVCDPAQMDRSWSEDVVRVSFNEADPQRRAALMPLPKWFTDATDAATPPEWIPFLPTPHTFKHPAYGDVVLTPERNGNFVTQFNAGVYQKPITLDGEHETKLSGAMGWIYELRANEDGSVDAKVEWTTRGATLYREGGYKYISPEWYDEWQDPATGETYSDIAIGAALTTRPFFKPPHLRPLAASEGAVGDTNDQPDAGERSQRMTATTDAVSPQQFGELQGKFEEMSVKFREVEAARTAAETERDTLKTANESLVGRVDAMERQAREKKYAEVVREWPGKRADHVAVLETLGKTFGEESEQFKAHVATMDGAAAALKVSGIFNEVGSDAANNPATATAQVEAKAKEIAASEKITIERARVRVFNEDPELASAYEAEQGARR